MRPPLRGRRADARRLAARLRELAGMGSGGELPADPGPSVPAQPASRDRADDAVARLDAARHRLRSSITPPEEDGQGE